MAEVEIFTDRRMAIGEVSSAMFGSFVEHLGRCVYTGIYEPGHPCADEEGFRTDVIELIKGLNISNVRYPGGNFLSGYNWRDGIGKKENRPVRADLAWASLEPNTFGTDEFISWCRKAGVEPMLSVNLGTGTPKEAAELVEYCNHPGGTFISDMRKENGNVSPYNVRMWCLGNEMDGPWQMCSLSAEDYSKKALSASRMMRMIDPSIKLVACGSSNPEMDTYPEWDKTVMEALYDEADYISLHEYFYQRAEETEYDFYASYKKMDDYIKTIAAAIEYVRVKKRSSKRMAISFDEWNVWDMKTKWNAGWEIAPRLLEDNYSFRDALVFGGLLNTLMNNCDSVKAACLAQLVNVIAPIFTEPKGGVVRQSTYYPFEIASRYGRGSVLRTITKSPTFESCYGVADFISSCIVYDERTRRISVFAVNYANTPLECSIELNGFGEMKAEESLYIKNKDLEARNTIGAPDEVIPEKGEIPGIKDNVVSVKLEPLSYNLFTFLY